MDTNKIIHGFRHIADRQISELKAVLRQFEHEKTGARLLWLDRDDENKTFAIAFRTLPEDDTGVFHILEHSVLCGSERYPTKEPFVELLKSSMQTFLNAFTFPDKTVYPVSSRNDQDFLNLMRVYLDATLHPLIYRRPEIFHQEGWHYEFDENGQPSYKGVVFNEMKGAFASPDNPVENETFRLLFPDNCYRYDSGGGPEHIPELTYEQFLDCHRRCYHPSNSYIFLDGRIDLDKALSVIGGEYLDGFERRDDQPQFVMQAPVRPEPATAYYEISKNDDETDRARMVWGYVIGDHTSRETVIAMNLLADAICGNNQAPLTQKLLSEGLAQDVSISVMDGLLQPYVILDVNNMKEENAALVEKTVREELERLANEGLDHSNIAAALANMEFNQREHDFGYFTQGIGFALSALDSWLYGGDPAQNLEIGDVFDHLNAELEKGYFENLLRKVFLENDHSCQVTILPSKTLGDETREKEALRLKAAKESWTSDEEKALHVLQAKLEAFQQANDSPEDIAKLPKLSLSDIAPQPENFPIEETALDGHTLLLHPIATSGIDYINLYFDVSDLPQDKLSLLSFMTGLLGKLPTKVHDASELQRLSKLYFGGLSFSVESYNKVNHPESCKTYLCVSMSALETKLSDAAAIAAEILTSTLFTDDAMIRELLNQAHTAIEQSIIRSGSSYATVRVSAGYSATGFVQEHTAGFTYCQWLKELKGSFEERAASLRSELDELAGAVFESARLTLSITGTDESASEKLASLIKALPEGEKKEYVSSVVPWGLRHEGIVIPADVSFAVIGGNLLDHGGRYDGRMLTLAHIVSLDYLWNVVRVQGGAYGTGMRVSDNGVAVLHSYRDPSGVSSLDKYRRSADFIRSFCEEEPDMTGSIIGTISDTEAVLLPRRMGKTSDILWLKGVSFEDRCRTRSQILSMTYKQLKELTSSLESLTKKGSICVVGSKGQIEACGEQIDTVYTL